MTKISIALLLTLPLLLLNPLEGLGQPLTLDECIAMAYKHLAYDQQTEIYRQSSNLAVKNAGKNWLPKIMVDGSFSYQNENTRVPVELPVAGFEFPGAPLNFNRLLVNFTQAIYDGSVTGNKKNLERSKYTILEKQMEVEKIQAKSRVISLYMSIQLTDDKLVILENRKEVIAQRNVALVRAAEFGGATVVNIKTLDAELLVIDQNIIEVQYARAILLASLSEIIGRKLPETQELLRPNPKVVFSDDVDARPEIQLLDSKIENLDFQKAMVQTSRLPTLGAFATVGAGSPGYDIFDNQLAPMAMIGAKLQWHIFDWNLAKNEKKILAASQSVARNDRLRVKVLLTMELKTHQREIEMMNALLAKDEELVQLRADISAIKVTELENGTITSTEYISELNLEEEARLNQRVHELRLILAKLNYITLLGNY